MRHKTIGESSGKKDGEHGECVASELSHVVLSDSMNITRCASFHELFEFRVFHRGAPCTFGIHKDRTLCYLVPCTHKTIRYAMSMYHVPGISVSLPRWRMSFLLAVVK